MFLDACRDNPFIDPMHGYTRSVGSRGLAETEASLGTLVAYAAQPGSVASDGAGHHSPFTTALLKNLGRPGDSISQSLTRVRRAVCDATRGNQIPQDFNSLLDEIYFTPASSESDKEAALRAQIAAAQAKINQLRNKTKKRWRH